MTLKLSAGSRSTEFAATAAVVLVWLASHFNVGPNTTSASREGLDIMAPATVAAYALSRGIAKRKG